MEDVGALSDEITEAYDLLITQYGGERWLYNAVVTRDDGGRRLEVQVVDSLYEEDVLPRKLGGAYLVVVRVQGGEPPLDPRYIGKA